MTVAQRLRVLKALLRSVETDAVASGGKPGRHLLLALAAHATAWANETED